MSKIEYPEFVGVSPDYLAILMDIAESAEKLYGIHSAFCIINYYFDEDTLCDCGAAKLEADIKRLRNKHRGF